MTGPMLFSPEPDDAAVTAAAAPPPQTQSLYRKYRPQTFDSDDLVGQEHVVRTLRNAIALGRIAHAYLFCGPRGTGKTTTARLLAKAVNCLAPDPAQRPCNTCANCRAIGSGAATDVIEIDAASNRGIDDIRELRERVKYAPTQLRVKFYIIDEAHQITGAAANAFLKTLEEPPAHTKFVLATTDPEELLPTIVSRCQRFDFRRIGLDAIVARLRTVAATEGLTVEPDALTVIARHATGSLRDALGLLDQLAVYREAGAVDDDAITADAARALLGVSRNDRVETLVQALADRNASLALGAVNAAVEAGEDPRQLSRQLVAYLRVLLHERAGGSPDADGRARDLAARFELLELAELARRFSELDYRIKHSAFGQLPLEVALVEGVLRDQAEVQAPRRSAAPSPGALADAERAATPRRSSQSGAGVLASEPSDDRSTTTLRDRVRGVERPNSAASTAERATPPAVANGANPHATEGGGGLTVEQLFDLWPRIRQDVKAVNRRIEALLLSCDPYAVSGKQVTLVSAYEFHRNRLNTDEVRSVVEDVITRLTGQPVAITCIMRGDEPPDVPSPPPAPDGAPAPAGPPTDAAPVVTAAPTPPARPDDAADVPDPAAEEQRVQAAKNIFDAEEIAS